MLKEHILRIALKLFSQNGIKKVSMNDIAQQANVSKRTLYDFFENKESLLIRMLESSYYQFNSYLTELEKRNYTSLEIFLLFNDKLMANPTWFSQTFYDDIHLYPKAYAFLMENKNKFLDKSVYLLSRGVEEGVFQPEINYDMLALLVREQMTMPPPAHIFKKYSHIEVHNTFSLIFIRGICTQKGRGILERYYMKRYYQNKQIPN